MPRGGCSFGQKAINAFDAGVKAIVFVNNQASHLDGSNVNSKVPRTRRYFAARQI